MPLTVQRYNVIEGRFVAADDGLFCNFADANKAYEALDEFTKAATAAKDEGAALLLEARQRIRELSEVNSVATRDLGLARERCSAFETSVRNVQKELSGILPTDIGATRADLEKKIDELKATLSTLQ